MNFLEKLPQQEKNTLNLEDYKEQAFRNIELMSRTMKGVLDTTASDDKAEKMITISGEELITQARGNFSKAIALAFENKDIFLTSSDQVQGFVELIAVQINKGVLKEGSLIRSGLDSEKYPYTRINDLSNRIEEFYKLLLDGISNGVDPVELAAFIEYRIDLTDHFFGDGCGKTAKVISSWILMKNDMDLPDYTQKGKIKDGEVRDAYYNNAPKTIPGTNTQKEEKEWEAWLKYYQTLCQK